MGSRSNWRTIAVFVLLALAGFASRASASSIPLGYVSWDLIAPGSTGEFDIANFTGPNELVPDFPVETSVNLSALSLEVDFTDGSTTTFGPSYFTLTPDGLSFNGKAIPVGGANPSPVRAFLTGSLSPLTITVTGTGDVTINPTFSAEITDATGGPLEDGDLAVIFGTTGGTAAPVPEPGTLVLLATGLLTASRKRDRVKALLAAARKRVGVLGIVACAVLLPTTGWAQVNLSTWTTPTAGVAGVTNVNVNGSGFPAGTITPSNVIATFSASCGGAPLATAPGTSIKTILGSTKRVNVVLPNTLPTGTLFVTLSDTAVSDPNFTSTDCSMVQVAHTSATLSACLPTSSLGINSPVNPGPVTAIVPRGSWSTGSTGIRVVQLEGAAVPGLPASVSTTVLVNSCAANSATGESVCVDNNTGVYRLNASGVLTSTLVSSSNSRGSFSGGSCENCGVAINALTNQAVIEMGFSPSPSNSALQVLDLNTGTFGTPFPLTNIVSENISVDPTRGYVLTPGETNHYDLVQFNSSTGALQTDFVNFVGGSGEMDSAAEDCTTGIALAPYEFTSSFYIQDLTQAVFNSTTKTYTAPGQIVTLAGTTFDAGASGMVVAPGTSHLSLVTGEFGGSSFAVVQLPSTSGTGVPNIVDYAYVGGICGVSAGFDPHTISAYTSPNDGKPYAVMADWSTSVPSRLAVIDMAAVLAAPRTSGTHTVIGTACNSGSLPVVRFVPVP